jgi:hypothetical protein
VLSPRVACMMIAFCMMCIFCLTFKMSHDRGWRGSCCSEHET